MLRSDDVRLFEPDSAEATRATSGSDAGYGVGGILGNGKAFRDGDQAWDLLYESMCSSPSLSTKFFFNFILGIMIL